MIQTTLYCLFYAAIGVLVVKICLMAAYYYAEPLKAFALLVLLAVLFRLGHGGPAPMVPWFG